MEKLFVYRITSDIVSDIDFVVAANVKGAVNKYCHWWHTQQSKEITEKDILTVEKMGEAII